jgi:hypothetical protein
MQRTLSDIQAIIWLNVALPFDLSRYNYSSHVIPVSTYCNQIDFPLFSVFYGAVGGNTTGKQVIVLELIGSLLSAVIVLNSSSDRHTPNSGTPGALRMQYG